MRSALHQFTKQWVTSAARTATGNSGALNYPVDNITGGTWILNVTAASGTSPTLDVSIQITPDGGTTWFDTSRFTQRTGVEAEGIFISHQVYIPWFLNPSVHVSSGTTINTFDPTATTGGIRVIHTPFSRKFRILWTIAGSSPSLTFTVTQFANSLQMGGGGY
jgi:hypothetical protein